MLRLLYWQKFTDVPEEPTASIFRLKEQAELLVACFLDMFFDPEYVGSTFLGNFGKLISE
jgi:hypothetical protein